MREFNELEQRVFDWMKANVNLLKEDYIVNKVFRKASFSNVLGTLVQLRYGVAYDALVAAFPDLMEHVDIDRKYVNPSNAGKRWFEILPEDANGRYTEVFSLRVWKENNNSWLADMMELDRYLIPSVSV